MRIREEKKNLEITKEPLKDHNVRNRLLQVCEKAKIELSANFDATIRVDDLITDHEFYEDLNFELSITRAQFEEAGEKLFERMHKPI